MAEVEELSKCEANYGPLTPITFLQRAAAVHPERKSVVYEGRVFTWAETLSRCRCLASALQSHSVSPGDTVAILAPNVPAMYEAHFGVPMAGAVLNTINIRLDPHNVALMLDHAAAKVVLIDTELVPLVQDALSSRFYRRHPTAWPLLVRIDDPSLPASCATGGKLSGAHELKGFVEYEDFLRLGDPNFQIRLPRDEWEAISINYTSGTTSAPKGVVYHHRGAHLNALAAAMDWGMPAGPVYLWAVPMFHCNGWCFSWAMAALAGTNVCLRTVSAFSMYKAMAEHHVTHMGGAPIVLGMIVNAEDHDRRDISQKLEIWTGGSPPPAAVLAKLESLGFSVGHGYGLTETYGPAISCAWKKEWDSLPANERAKMKARQGVGHLGISDVDVMDPKTMSAVPRDGTTMGEVMIKGNTLMKGYLKNRPATEEAFRGGWFHTGDLGVMHPDGYIELKDRSKDIIISGGENISSIEVESVLFQHPHILEAAVVARPDNTWGETPCAFVTLKDAALKGQEHNPPSAEDIIEYCKASMARFKVPRSVVFGPLPKTSTGKIQKGLLRDHAKSLGSLSKTAKSKL